MKSFAIVVAMDENNGIGKEGTLAWHLPSDLKHFKEVTSRIKDSHKQNAVIMGRKTWESLPAKFKPLPGRYNVVLSRNKEAIHGAPCFESLDAALSNLNENKEIENIFVIGGAQIYKEAINHKACQSLFITHLKGDFNCDAFFPAIPLAFKRIEESSWAKDGAIEYHFCQYQQL